MNKFYVQPYNMQVVFSIGWMAKQTNNVITENTFDNQHKSKVFRNFGLERPCWIMFKKCFFKKRFGRVNFYWLRTWWKKMQPLSFFTKKKEFEHADKTSDTVFRKTLIISYPSKEPLTEKSQWVLLQNFKFFDPDKPSWKQACSYGEIWIRTTI